MSEELFRILVVAALYALVLAKIIKG